MKRISLSLISLGLISMLSVSAHAENKAGAATFTLAGGYDFFASKRNLQNTSIPLLGLGYNFTDHWGIEGIISFFNTNFEKYTHDNRTVNGTIFAVDGLYHFSPHKSIEPFLLAGVGVIGLNPNGNDANNEGNVNVGAGVHLFIDEVIAFRFEARDFYTFVGGKNDVVLDAGLTFFLNWC